MSSTRYAHRPALRQNRKTMKRIILTISLILSSLIGFGQCPASNIIINSQGQIDNFSSTYPGCNQITVDIQINGFGITNLSGMSQITSMNGELRVFNTNLTTLGGLGTINFFGSNSGLYISGNPNLNSLGNFSGQLNRSSAGTLLVKDLPNITSLDELSGITSTTALWIENMQGLVSLSGLQNMAVNGLLVVRNNNNLTDLSAFSGNLGIFYIVQIGSNDSLVSLNGMEGINLGDIGISSSSLIIDDHNVLSNINALSSITFLPENMLISGNAQLPSLQPLSNMTGSASTIQISGNDALQNLIGLQGINNVQNELFIRLNNNLTSLNGLQGLTNTGNNPTMFVFLGDNPQLTDITGLNNVNPNSASFCLLENNTSLGVCATIFTCAALDAGVPFTFTNNMSGCNSIPEVETDCLLLVSEFDLRRQIWFLPNPISEKLQIHTSDGITLQKAIVYTLLGEKLICTANETIDFSALSDGIYIMHVVTDRGSVTRKIVKE